MECRNLPNETACTGLKAIRRVIAVVGCQRSGTTLTGQVLGALPEALLIDEFDGLYPWFHAFVSEGRDEGGLFDRVLVQAAEKYRSDDKRSCMVDDRLGLSPSVKVLVLKAPNLTFDEEKLARFPLPVTVVYPVRDPRAVVASMDRLSQIDFLGNQAKLMAERPLLVARHAAEHRRIVGGDEPAWSRRAVLWRLKSGRAPDFRRAGLPVHSLRYEDLVSRPEAVIPSLLKACGFGAWEHPTPAHEVYRGLGPGATDRTRSVDTSSMEAWRSALSPTQQADVMAAAQPLAGVLGYE